MHFLVELIAAGFLADGQMSLRPSPQDALRLVEDGQFARARQVIPGLIEDAKRTGSAPGWRAKLWHLLGAAANRLGRYQEAEDALNRGLQLCDHMRPAAPELTIALLVELADASLNQGHPDEANRVLHRAMGIASKDLPPGHPRMASVQHSLGVLFWMQGQLSRAEKAFRLAMTILEGSLRAGHADVALAAIDLAGLLTITGRQAEAVPLFERSKTVFERVYGPDHPDTIAATYALGVALTKSAPARAEVMLRQAVANWRASQPERHPNMVKFLAALASSRWAQGDASEAGVLGEQALRLSRELFGPEHPDAIAQMCDHARLLKAIRRGKEAAALKKEADRIGALKGYREPGRHQIDILALRGRY
jgi:tetratricopeptide (TPR) repeat protein